MAATEAQIARLRRMTAEPTVTPYSDALLAEYIERYPIPDSARLLPSDTNWVPTYDLNAAAAEIWSEKSAGLVANGEVYEADSVHLQAVRQTRFYQARRVVRASPIENRYPEE